METAPDKRAVFFFDIDNCLYPKSTNIHGQMARLINKFFVTHLNVTAEDATRLHEQYYKDYGLAIEGLCRFHKIDALDFNREVDDALVLDEVLRPDRPLRALLEAFDPAKVKLWLFTNAHSTHARRVVGLLGVADLFEGITFCDYASMPLVPKPKEEMFVKAETEAGVTESTRVYYVDDSALNCGAAYQRGWQRTVHLREVQEPKPASLPCKYEVNHLKELVDLFPELLKS